MQDLFDNVDEHYGDYTLEEPFSLYPKEEGTSYLGLDVSQHSTGIALITPDGFATENISLTSTEPAQHLEIILRREFKSRLKETLTKGDHFTGIAIEDVYSGLNPKTIRTLYSLNGVIDELIIDGYITCDKFARVQNGRWRKILRQAVPEYSKALNEKIFVKETLAQYGITQEGKGSEDRLDALGIAMSLYLTPYDGSQALSVNTSIKARLAPLDKVQAVYVNNYPELEPYKQGRVPHIFTDRPTLKNIRETLGDCEPDDFFYTKTKVNLGSITNKLGVPPRPFGGYLGFWLKG